MPAKNQLSALSLFFWGIGTKNGRQQVPRLRLGMTSQKSKGSQLFYSMDDLP
jgi:hypothetical protein